MRKLSTAMAVIMLFVSCFVFTARAGNNQIKVKVITPAEASEGATFTVKVDFSENTGFNTLGVKLTYPEGFTYVDDSADASALIKEKCFLDFAGFEGETYVFYHDASKRTLTFVGASLEDIVKAADTLFTAKFKAPSGVSNKNKFTVQVVDTAYNEIGDEVSVDLTDGSMNVIKATYVLGDVDGNGAIQTTDAMLALFAATNKITLTETQMLAANVISTDGLNTADAIRILYYATKKISSF